MTIKAKISYPAHDTVRVEVERPDGTPRVIVRRNRFQAVIEAARALNDANAAVSTTAPEAPDEAYQRTLRRAVVYNTQLNARLDLDRVEIPTQPRLADSIELLEVPSVEAYAMSQFDKLAKEPGD